MSTKKSTISPEVVKIIRKSVDEAVKKAAEAIVRANKEFDASQRNYFKETERLLYSLPALRLKVAQDEEDLRNGFVSPHCVDVDYPRHGIIMKLISYWHIRLVVRTVLISRKGETISSGLV